VVGSFPRILSPGARFLSLRLRNFPGLLPTSLSEVRIDTVLLLEELSFSPPSWCSLLVSFPLGYATARPPQDTSARVSLAKTSIGSTPALRRLRLPLSLSTPFCPALLLFILFFPNLQLALSYLFTLRWLREIFKDAGGRKCPAAARCPYLRILSLCSSPKQRAGLFLFLDREDCRSGPRRRGFPG